MKQIVEKHHHYTGFLVQILPLDNLFMVLLLNKHLRVFERDVVFRHVKSKGASGKSSKRRLVCIKKKTESVSDFPPARRGILKEWISSVSSPEDDPRSSATDKLPSPTRKSRPEASVSSQPGFCHPMQCKCFHPLLDHSCCPMKLLLEINIVVCN